MRQRFPRLWADRQLIDLQLGRRSKGASLRLVHAALGPKTPEDQVRRFTQRADGNPFFLEELIRTAAVGAATTLPDTVLGMVEARVAGLDPEARLVLRAASVFGEVFWAGGIEALVGSQPLTCGLHEWLRTLGQREVIVGRASSRFHGEAQYDFRHGLLREACHATLTDRDKRAAHRLAATWLESHGETNAAVLARHAELGADPASACRWFARAARDALQAGDLQGEVHHIERGLRTDRGLGRRSTMGRRLVRPRVANPARSATQSDRGAGSFRQSAMCYLPLMPCDTTLKESRPSRSSGRSRKQVYRWFSSISGDYLVLLWKPK